MDTLIDVAENATVDLSIARTVLGEAMDYLDGTDALFRAMLPNYAEQIYHLLIVVDHYISTDMNDLQKAVEKYYHKGSADDEQTD